MIVSVLATTIVLNAWRKRLTWPRSLAAIVNLLVFGSLSFSAAAQESAEATSDVFSAVLGYSVTSDDNLFRAANAQSDVIRATTGTLRFDKPLSQQRFQFAVTETFTRYNDFSYLDFDGTSYRGSWLWSISPRLNATVSADGSKSLAAFEDTLSTQRNVTTTKNTGVNLEWWVSGGWYLDTGVSHSDLSSEHPIQNSPDEVSNHEQIGVRYVAQSGNSIGLTRGATQGDYENQGAPGLIGTGFTEDTTGLNGIWKVSEKSELNGSLTYIDNSNDQIGRRDFMGRNASFQYLWKATSKLSFNLAADRNTGPLNNPFFSYTVNRDLSLTPTWKISDKLIAHVRLAHGKYGYYGEGTLPAIVPARRDTINGSEVGVDWSPMRNLSIKSSLRQERRSSNQALQAYDDNIGMISAAWTFW